jgi:biotin operon repressor
LRLRDDDHSSLALLRTEIGEQPESEPVSQDLLLQLCLEYGDAKASLKFLVVQTKPSGSSAAIVPPMEARQLPPINTQVGPNRNSKDGGSSATTSERIDQWSEASHPDSTDASSYDPSRRSMKSIPSSSSRSLHDHLHSPRGSPVQQPQAGPSRPRSPLGLGMGMGMGMDDGMDDATRALIESIQKEDEDARRQQQARRQQMEADEKLAREAQQSERDVWQAMQQLELEGNRRRQEQIERDEQRAVSMSQRPG